MFLGKGVLKICSKFTGEHPCQSVISIKLRWSFIGVALRCGRSPVNFLHIFRTSFPKNTCEGLLVIVFYALFVRIHFLFSTDLYKSKTNISLKFALKLIAKH